jgi:L-ascorbate metabolism protein UlaG (beta-lactamase superfamily)
MIRSLAAPAIALAAALLAALPAAAQDRRASHCIAIADATPGLRFIDHAAQHRPTPVPASFRAPLPDDWTVRLNYVAHATFLLETPGGLTAATDFTGFLGATTLIPDVVTMNHAHSTHWTANPDPAIPNVLRGWTDADGPPADHWLDLGEMTIRNVSTDIRSRWDTGVVEKDGNSIFIFEVGGLCIGHLGHLHHEPSEAQYAAIGRLDVVMAPVDGGMTIDLPTLLRMMDRMKSSVVIPMHWFGSTTLDYFLAEMSTGFDIRRPGTSFVELGLRDLPDRPTVIVLEPRWLSDAP